MKPRIEKQAVRAYYRVLSNLTDGWDQMEACDRHYDGGEWSGPAWAKCYDDASCRAAAIVAERFDVDADDLCFIAECEWPMDEESYRWRASQERRDEHLRRRCGSGFDDVALLKNQAE